MTAPELQTPEQHRARYLELRRQAQARAAITPAPTVATVVPQAGVLRRECIPGGWYSTLAVRRGEVLRIEDTHGTACVSALLWNAHDTSERYNAGDTVKLQWTARLTKGRVLFSDMGRVLAAIVEDTHGEHDALLGGSTPASNARRYGDASLRNTRDNLFLAAGKLGLQRRDVSPCISFFAPVRVDAAGRLAWHRRPPRPGDYVELRAEMDVLVALSNCPHPLDPAALYAPTEVTAIVCSAPPPADDDACRNFSEEAVRGFQNTDTLFAA